MHTVETLQADARAMLATVGKRDARIEGTSYLVTLAPWTNLSNGQRRTNRS